jgi:subtilisin family serine protease
MKRCFLLLLVLVTAIGLAQEDRFYVRTISENVEIPVSTKDSVVTYTGKDAVLKKLFSEHRVKVFRKGFKYATRDKLKRSYFVIADSPQFQKALLTKKKDLFEFGETIDPNALKVFEPNDYGITSTIGKTTSNESFFLDYYDFLGVPQAWYYTTGSRDVIIGISDAKVDPQDIEFRGKTKIIKSSRDVKGHGMSVAATAAANGDNGYGIPGICYDCSIYTTNYGDFRQFRQLLELSRAGARVINCSWGSPRYYDTAQEVINEMRDNGTVIVSVPHNRKFNQSEGEKIYYPGGYEHVISVGAIQHRFEDPRESMAIEEKTGNFYAQNVKNTVARTGRFKGNNPDGEFILFASSTSNMDRTVDIMAPGNFVFRYGRLGKLEEGESLYNQFSATSPSAPLVTGTIGLMFSLNPCLSVDEVNSIIKLSATNIDHIPGNKPFKGNYGAGALHTGRAVKMVHDMLDPTSYTMIENQNFTRWNFKLDAAHKIKIRNQRFTDSSTVHFTAKREILIEKETVFLPSEKGSVFLEVTPDAEYTCKDSN